MRRSRFLLLILLGVAAVFLWEVQVSFSKDRFHRFTMENGMRVILEENRAAPVVALQIWVKVGSADEKEDEAGIAHFIEHMLFKGTEKRGVRGMAGEIESLGGYINAYTSYDQTVYHVTLASRYWEIGLDLLNDAIGHSTFNPAELEKEREVILEEIRMGQDSPFRRLYNQTVSTLYRVHPYRRPIIGYERTVRAITRDQMISFFKRRYTPDRMVFVAVGDFSLQEMEEKVRRTFNGFGRSFEGLPERIGEPRPCQTRSAISYGNFKETYLQIAFLISSARHEDTPALDALSRILGEGEASRLVQKVKLEKGFVNSISTSSITPKDPGLFIIGATLPAGNVGKTIEAILNELIRLGHEGVKAEELRRVKVSVESSLIYDRQTVQGQARRMGYYEVIAGDVQYEREYVKKMSLLRSEDIQRVVDVYFKPSRSVVSILAPSEKTVFFNDLDLLSIIERVESEEAFPSKEKKGPVSKIALKNGMRLIIKESRAIPLVTIQASFLGGVRFEEESQNGINHFLAIMLTKGTKNRTSLQIEEKVDGMGGSLNGFSGYNSFGLTFTFLNQHFKEAFELFAEMIKEASLDREEMEKRRRLIVASIEQQEDNLNHLIFKLFLRTLYEKHPYGMDTLGTLASVRNLTQKDLKGYYERFFVPENMVLTVVGDVDERQVALAAEKAFGDLRRISFSPPDVPKEPPLREIRRYEMYRLKEQAHFVLGFPGVSFQHKDRYALEVLDAALSGQTGRLFRELREKESLAYALDFVVQLNLDPGFIGAYMGTHPDKLGTAIDRVLGELKKVREEGLTVGELARAKRYLIGNFEIGLQTNGAQANQISFDELYGLGFDHYQRYAEEIEKVSREDVDRVARQYLNPEAYALAIIRPPGEKKE